MEEEQLLVKKKKIESITEFVYLGSLQWNVMMEARRSEKNCKGYRSYGAVWKDLQKQEYQHGSQDELTKSDLDERGNECERNMDAEEKRQRQTASV